MEIPESNILIPPIEGPVAQEAFTIYRNMMNASAAVFGKEICSLCEKQKGQLRTHFHGSEFGKCFRQTEFNMLQGSKEKNTGQEAIQFYDGHLHEEAIRKLLSKDCFLSRQDEEKIINQPVYLPDNTRINVEIVMHTDNLLAVELPQNTHHSGYDLLTNPIPKFVTEYKAVKNWYFKERAKKGIISNHYYGQCQCYLEAYNLDYCLLFFKNRESSEILPPIVIKRDPYYIKRRFTYLAGILYSISQKEIVPNEYTDKKCDACKFCEHYEKCWGK